MKKSDIPAMPRDMLALGALIGIIAAHSTASDFPDPDDAARRAYGYADAMERQKDAVIDLTDEEQIAADLKSGKLSVNDIRVAVGKEPLTDAELEALTRPSPPQSLADQDDAA